MAEYDDSGILLNVSKAEISAEGEKEWNDSVSVKHSSEAACAKVYLWDKKNQFKPLCRNVTIRAENLQ